MTLDAIARDIAEAQAGATWEHLRAQEEVLRRQMDTYWAAYCAAVASERQQASFAPPPLTTKQAAAALNLSEYAVRELIRTRRLRKLEDIGNHVLIPRSEIDRLLEGA